jgi:hypothetical protein
VRARGVGRAPPPTSKGYTASHKAVVEQARRELQAFGVYGLASADVLEADGKLPYCENLVNLLMIRTDCGVPLTEAARALCPNGVLVLCGSKTSAAELADAGLVDVRSSEAGKRPASVAFKRSTQSSAIYMSTRPNCAERTFPRGSFLTSD